MWQNLAKYDRTSLIFAKISRTNSDDIRKLSTGNKRASQACIEPPAILLGLKPAADTGIISR
jgi:hypothetical protein